MVVEHRESGFKKKKCKMQREKCPSVSVFTPTVVTCALLRAWFIAF